MKPEAASHPESRKPTGGGGVSWVAVAFLAVPVGLAAWRIAGLGYGSTDLVAHFVLDLLVSACLLTLLSGPLRGRPPLPAFYALALVLLALYVGWLYLSAGLATAGFLFGATLVVGYLLRLLREKLSIATFLRSGWMEEFGLAGGDVPADAVYTPDPRTGGHAVTWRRYVAFPVLCGLLLAFLAVRVARPLDKRADARAVLATGEPHKIATAFLKAATNGHAPLFVRENLPWYTTEQARAHVMEQAGDLLAAFQRSRRRLGLQWIDLSTLPGRIGDASTTDDARIAHTCAGRAMAWLEDPEDAPEGLAWVDAGRPHRGFHAYVEPITVTLERTPDGLRVVDVTTTFDIALRKP